MNHLPPQPTRLRPAVALVAFLWLALGTSCSYLRPPEGGPVRDVTPASVHADGGESPVTMPASLP